MRLESIVRFWQLISLQEDAANCEAYRPALTEQ